MTREQKLKGLADKKSYIAWQVETVERDLVNLTAQVDGRMQQIEQEAAALRAMIEQKHKEHAVRKNYLNYVMSEIDDEMAGSNAEAPAPKDPQ